MKFTSFNAEKTKSKFPKSPYGDNSFMFETFEGDLKDIFLSLSDKFTLNIPLNIDKTIQSKRQVKSLKAFINEKINYIILDLDEIHTLADRELCLRYFRNEKLSVILGESRSQYNIKGVLGVQEMNIKEARVVLQEIQEQIKEFAKVDLTVLNKASYQAPINKHNILLEQTNHVFHSYIKPKITKTQETKNYKTQDLHGLQEICINLFHQKGFKFLTPTEVGYKCSHVSEIKSPGGFSWNREYPFVMNHWNTERNVVIWNEVIKTDSYKNFQKNESMKMVKSVLPKTIAQGTQGTQGTQGDLCVQYLDGNTDTVKEFLDTGSLLTIQSPMGTAKSTVIEEILHQCSKRDLRVLFLTNRISLADDITSKYTNIKHYQGTEIEDNEYKPGDNLAVQIDSFHKFSTKYFDVVILDEFTTTAIKLLTTERHQVTTANKFFSLKKKKIVFSDAFLLPGMVDLFKNENTQIKEITNNYRDTVDLEIFEHKNAFVDDIIQTAKRGPVTFSSGSTIMLQVIKYLAEVNNLTNFCIDSKTSKQQKEAVFSTFDSIEPKWNILMYSPSLTVGVSNSNEVPIHFHYDTGMSVDVLSSIQMIKRTRKAKKIKMFLGERIKYENTDLVKIQNEMFDYNEQDEDGDEIGITETGYKLSKIIRINNILENRHQLSFMELLKFQFKNKPVMNSTTSDLCLHQLIKIVKQKETDNTLDIFEAYRKMSKTEISEIEMKLFGTNKQEIYIKEFENTKDNLEMGEPDKEMLIKENIKNPGTLENYLNYLKFLETGSLQDRNGKVTMKEYKMLLAKGVDIKTLGYKRKKHLYVLNPVIQELLRKL